MTSRNILAAGLCLAVGGCCCGRTDWTRYTIHPDAARPSLDGDTRTLRLAAETAAGALGGFSQCPDRGDWAWAAVRDGAAEHSPEHISIRVASAKGEPFVEIVHVHGGAGTWYYRCHPPYEKLCAALAAALRAHFAERLAIVTNKDDPDTIPAAVPPPHWGWGPAPQKGKGQPTRDSQ